MSRFEEPCVCFCTWQERKWAETDAKGRPIGQGCWVHVAVASQLFPDRDLLGLAEEYRESENPEVRFKMDAASEVLEKTKEIDVLLPASVSTQAREGHEVYFEVAVVTNADLQRLTGMDDVTGKKLNLVECNLNLEQHGACSSVYFMSLRGCPLDELFSLRKVRVSASLATTLEEHHLRPSEMLSQDHGSIQFKYHAAERKATMPDCWLAQPASKLLTLADLNQKARKFQEAGPFFLFARREG